ncbi:MAG: ATP synthase subunit I [Chloroflexi bacterium]|nr:ATP synthase subunit I [Chloroflexota bacterium]
MTDQPSLSAVWRRLRVLSVVTVVPLAVLLLVVRRPDGALGLLAGSAVALINTQVLIRRIERAAGEQATRARTIMQQGLAARFTIVVLASIVLCKLDSRSIPSFAIGMVTLTLLATAIGARLLLQTSPSLDHVFPVRGPETHRAMVGRPLESRPHQE